MSNTTTMPMAYVTVNKGRKKMKNEVVFMDNGTEFEIELFNPTQNTVLSKISINNKLISYSGIVLRPGERVFLERYLDNPSRFKFETYSVNGNAEEIKEAIEKNGLIKVEFYNEDTTPLYTPQLNLWKPNGVRTFTDNWSSIGGQDYGTMYCSTSIGTTYNTGLNTTLTSSVAGSNEPFCSKVKKKSIKSTETGRIEQGSHSEQSFQTVSKKFYSYTTNVIEYHIKPTSQMPIEVKDINKMGKYCTKCGRKGKPTDNFCAGCGNRY